MKIQLIPAIDILGGKCVRLTKGDYDQKKVYDDNPVDQARRFEDMGFTRLHVVDLDGAKSKHIVNEQVLCDITSHTHLEVDFGGGIKSDADIQKAFEAGACMVTVGSVAVSNPDLFVSWLKKYGSDHLILGADTSHGKISVNGWLENSEEELIPFLGRYVKEGVTNVLCTEISRDGTLGGPAIDLYIDILKHYPHLNLIASGGVGSADDIVKLDEAGVPAVVFGKAWYEGRLDVKRLGYGK